MAFLPPELLRSVIRVTPADPEADLLQNLAALRHEVVPQGIDAVLLTFVGRLVDKTGCIPTFKVLYGQYTARQHADPEAMPAMVRLGEVVTDPAGPPPVCLDPPAFRAALDRFKADVTGDSLGVLIQQATAILSPGWAPPVTKGKPVTLKGPEAAMGYLQGGIDQIQQQFFAADIEGSWRPEADDVWERYQARKAAVLAGTPLKGACSGFPEIDDVHDGLMPGDLALVLGYTSQFKSTLCFNWAYNAALSGKSVGIVPLEMSARTLLGSLAVIHCYHPKFEAVYGPQIKGVTYDAFRRGLFNALQEEIFKAALDDLQHNTEYGQIYYKEPQGATTVATIRRWAERLHRKHTLDLIVVDYLGLVNSESGGNSLKESSVANATLREAKQMATSFADGRGIALLSPWQASREGFKEAQQAAGQYTLRACSWANEAERSSDFVYWVYTDDEMKDRRVLSWGNLKARDREQITGIHTLHCNPAARVIAHLAPFRPTQAPVDDLTGSPKTAVPDPAVSTVGLGT